MSDVLALIKRDHESIKVLFRQFEELAPDANVLRTKLAKKIMDELVAHDRAEEESLYAALQGRLDGTPRREARVNLLKAYAEHEAADDLMHKLESTDPKEEEFVAKLMLLHASVEQHIRDEESQIHPIARRCLSADDLDELGTRFLDAKKHVMA